MREVVRRDNSTFHTHLMCHSVSQLPRTYSYSTSVRAFTGVWRRGPLGLTPTDDAYETHAPHVLVLEENVVERSVQESIGILFSAGSNESRYK